MTEQMVNVEYNSPKNENNIPVDVSDFDKICRTCLTADNIMPISVLKYNETLIVNFMESCACIHVEENDGLPQNMCSVCLQEIIKIHLFQEKCKQNENLLSVLLAEPKEIKLELYNETIKQEELQIPTNYSDSDTQSHKVTETKPVHRKIKKPKTLACRYCLEEFASSDKLKNHKKIKHSAKNNHTCSVCGKKCANNSKLHDHMRTHTKEKPFKCPMCSQSFTLRGNLKRHAMIHTGERPHVCEFCGKAFNQATTLQGHLKTHSARKPADEPKFVCSVCGMSFKRFNDYNFHLKQHGVDELGEEEIKPAMEEVCEICKRVYSTKRLLQRHLLTHGEKKFLCSYCGKGFVRNASLQSHLKVHTGKKPYSCSVCKKTFGYRSILDAHMLIHMGRKPYRCKFCGKNFTQSSHLKSHLRIHTGERPYSCTQCGKSFRLRINLTVHVRMHTGETPFVCSVCGKGFYDSSSMKRHQSCHGEVKVQQSADCDVVAQDAVISS